MNRIASALISLLVTSSILTGCPSTTELSVEFDASSRSGGAPLTVSFQNLTEFGEEGTNDDTNTQWHWEFGDGSTSEERTPTHTYTQGGTYSVTLTVTSGVGIGSKTKSDFIQVTEQPIASFVFDATPTRAPLAVQFEDTSFPGYPPINSWLWNFGDGTTSTEQNPIHTYTEAGEYRVSLQVTSTVAQDQFTTEEAVIVLSDRDYHTQILSNPNSLDGKQVYFVPSYTEKRAGDNYYRRVITATDLAELPVDPTGHDVVDFGDDFTSTIDLGEGGVFYFGEFYSRIVIGINGTVAFGGPGGGNDTLAEHFAAPQISLFPVDATSGGTVTVGNFTDSVVVTFENIRIGATSNNAFQLELFKTRGIDGDIALSYPKVPETAEGIVGLSNGLLAGASAQETLSFLANFRNTDFNLNSNTASIR